MHPSDFNRYFEALELKSYIEETIEKVSSKVYQVTNKLIEKMIPNPKASEASIGEVTKFIMADKTPCLAIRWTRTIYTSEYASDKTENGTFVIPYWILCESNPVAEFIKAKETGIWKEKEKLDTKQT